jgi:hypothetical protein
MWGALSDERTGLSFARDTVSSSKSVVSMYNLHFTCYYTYVYMYIQYIQGLGQSKLSTADHALLLEVTVSGITRFLYLLHTYRLPWESVYLAVA